MKLKKDQHILSKMKKRIIEKVFISGSSGFIGRNLYNFLKKEYLILKPSRNIIDLRNKKKLNSYLKQNKPNFIIHLASSTNFKDKPDEEKKNQYDNTYKTTLNIAKTINKECSLVIFFGSIEEYGNIKYPFKENYKPQPISEYGKYKLKALKEVQKILNKKNINYLWVRPSLTFGKYDNKERFLGHIIHSIKNKNKIEISPGTKKRDYLYIEDLCKIIRLIIKRKNEKFNYVLNISSQNYVPLSRIPSIIERILKKKIDYKLIKTKDVQTNLLNSNSKLKKLFPKIKFSNFYKCLKKTLKYEKLI